MNAIFQRIAAWRAQVKKAVCGDMNRIAGSTTGVALPPAPLDRPAHRPEKFVLRFSHRRSQLLAWRVLHHR